MQRSIIVFIEKQKKIKKMNIIKNKIITSYCSCQIDLVYLGHFVYNMYIIYKT